VPFSIRKKLGISNAVSVVLDNGVAYLKNSEFLDGVVLSKNCRRLK
jgi:hypothetical protein